MKYMINRMFHCYTLIRYLNCFHIFLSFLLLLSLMFQASAQNVTYAYKNIKGYKSFLQKISEENALFLNKKTQKTYREFINEKNTELIKRLNEKGFLFDTIAYPYLNSIFNHILEKNSLDKNRFHFFVD